MSGKSVSLAIVILLLANLVALVFCSQQVQADLGTIYINSDGSVYPATAQISTNDNVTYTFTGNIVNDSIVVERDNIVVDGAQHMVQDAGTVGIDLSGRTNVTVKNTQIENSGYGVMLNSSFSNSIIGNNITNNNWGMWLRYSSNNTIIGNNITNNDGGIELDSSSSNNSIIGNNITGGNGGVESNSSSNNTISGNNIVNYWQDITVGYSSNDTITGNNIAGGLGGISLVFSPNGTISGNNITNNNFGIYVDYSSDNRIYENNFIDNKFQAYIVQSINVWDDGARGNHWSDYNGTDVTHPGIGDTPYVIDSNNVDNYPLTQLIITRPESPIWASPVFVGAIVAVIAVAVFAGLVMLRTKKPETELPPSPETPQN